MLERTPSPPIFYFFADNASRRIVLATIGMMPGGPPIADRICANVAHGARRGKLLSARAILWGYDDGSDDSTERDVQG